MVLLIILLDLKLVEMKDSILQMSVVRLSSAKQQEVKRRKAK